MNKILPPVCVSPVTCIADNDNWIFFLETQYKRITHTHMSTHLYEHMHVYSIPMNTPKKLSWFDLKIYEVGH
jgi:hypothetical protein